MTLQFNLPKISDPVENAALQGLVQVEKAKYKASELNINTGPLVDDFFVGDGHNGIREFLIREEQGNATPTGTNVYYDWQFKGASADHTVYQFTNCQDQNKFFDKSFATGQIVPQPSGLAQIVGFKVDMLKDKDGRWKAAYYGWTTGDATCQKAEGH